MKARRLASVLCSAGAAGLYVLGSPVEPQVAFASGKDGELTAQDRQKWPQFSRTELKQHGKFGNSWVVFRDSVYDITDFIDKHPGGDLIHMAFGKSVEPYWNIFSRAHLTESTIAKLEKYKIGEILPADRDRVSHARLDYSGTEHKIRPESFVLECDVEGEEVKLTLDDIRSKFPSRTLETIIDCGHGIKPLPYLDSYASAQDWDPEVDESPAYQGVTVQDFLAGLGMKTDPQSLEGKFIHFSTYDEYTDSIEISDLIKDKRALIVWGKDGDTLPKEQGGPLMALTPGEENLPCDIKWLTSIAIDENPAKRHMGKTDYLIERKKMLEDCIMNNMHI